MVKLKGKRITKRLPNRLFDSKTVWRFDKEELEDGVKKVSYRCVCGHEEELDQGQKSWTCPECGQKGETPNKVLNAWKGKEKKKKKQKTNKGKK